MGTVLNSHRITLKIEIEAKAPILKERTVFVNIFIKELLDYTEN